SGRKRGAFGLRRVSAWLPLASPAFTGLPVLAAFPALATLAPFARPAPGSGLLLRRRRGSGLAAAARAHVARVAVAPAAAVAWRGGRQAAAVVHAHEARLTEGRAVGADALRRPRQAAAGNAEVAGLAVAVAAAVHGAGRRAAAVAHAVVPGSAVASAAAVAHAGRNAEAVVREDLARRTAPLLRELDRARAQL